jgi:Zn-finger nucleic acid-binding protein
MGAATLNCPMCGAAVQSDAHQCAHCQARLATVACPSCFGMIFLGAKFCPHCGEKAARNEVTADVPTQCPTCSIDLQAVTVGASEVHECAQCAGLWIGVEAFQQICADREKQAAVLGGAAPDPLATATATLEPVRYRRCPDCQTLMNRANFSDRSGIIIDVCRGHGTWFDREELRRVVEFIRAGGVEAARARDLERWAREKRRKGMSAPVTIEVPRVSGDNARFDDFGDVIYLIGRAILNLLKS